MQCRLCNKTLSIKHTIKPVPFFWGYDVESNDVLGVDMACCPHCGLVQLDLKPKLKNLLKKLYTSEQSTPAAVPSETGWGNRRVKEFFEHFPLAQVPESVLEVGCYDGYMLTKFLELGTRTALGVEPADIPPVTYPGLEVKRGFFDASLIGDNKFDLVYNLAVMEHIDDLNGFINTMFKATKEGGQVAIVVPNGEIGLRQGDLCLFLHEHLNYFTPYTLEYALRWHGFSEVLIHHSYSALYATAVRPVSSAKEGKTTRYSKSKGDLAEMYLEKIQNHIDWFKKQLEYIRKYKKNPRVALYGVNHSVMNLCHWGMINDGKFLLFDSDPAKWGKQPCGLSTKVHSPDQISEYNVTDIFVIPFSAQHEIYDLLKQKEIPGLDIHGIHLRSAS